MQILWNAFLTLLGFFLLVKGADAFVDGASGMAKKLGVSPLVIGLTIVAFGTSLPELAVSVTAALSGSNEIAVGNVTGSNIFNLLVVAGSSAVIAPLAIDRFLIKRDWPASIVAAALLCVFLLLGNNVSRMEAAVLLVIFAVMLFLQLRNAKSSEEARQTDNRKPILLAVLLVLGVAGIILGGEFAVKGASGLARTIGWSESLIGLTIVAVGTSLPELVTSIVAARRGENEIAMGNVIGSNLFNILCILGISAFVSPITVAPTAFIDAAFLLVISVVFWLVAHFAKIGKAAGTVMLLTYVGYMVYIINR